MGELDAVVCPGHPFADPLTGAAHACGHNGQVASMLGVASALMTTGAIRFLGGKQELLARGFFEDVDMSMMVHMGAFPKGKKITMGSTSNGFVGKLVKYKGREAHAGAAPHLGVNALNAAMLGLMGVNALHETFAWIQYSI